MNTIHFCHQETCKYKEILQTKRLFRENCTSKMNKAKLPTHIEIDASAYGIEKDSVILLEQLRTIDKRRLKDKVCHLDGPMLDKVNHALEISLELTFS